MAKIRFEFFIRVRSDPQGPYLDHFRVEESLGVGFDKMNQGLHQVLGFPAGRMDKDPVPPVDVAEDLFLGDKFLGIDLLDLLTISVLHLQGHLKDSLFRAAIPAPKIFPPALENAPDPISFFHFHFSSNR